MTELTPVPEGLDKTKLPGTAGSGTPAQISTYDLLCIISRELQASSHVINAVARVAGMLFPEKLEHVNRDFIRNMWMNRVLVQTTTNELVMVDADIWHDVYHYLMYFSGLDISKYTYSSDATITFPEWFETKVRDEPIVEVQTDKKHSDIPDTVTKAYVDIVNRLSVSLYVLDAFGSSPRENLRQNLRPDVGQTVILPPNT